MTSRRNSRLPRISPTDYERNFVVDKEFAIIEKFYWITGMIFTRSRTVCNFRGFLIACLDVVITLLYIYFATVNFYSAATHSTPHSSGYAFISAFANFSGVCVRFVVLFKRHHIRKCIDVISKLDSDLVSLKESKKMRRCLFWSCATAVLLPLVQMSFAMLFGDPHSDVSKFESFYLFANSQKLSVWIPVAIVVIRATNMVLCKSLPFLTVILCSFVFTRLRDINRSFISRLKSSIDTSSTSKLFSDYSVFYGRITKSVEQVEKSLSLVSFFLYGYILSCIFSVTSYLVTRPLGSKHMSAIFFQLVTFVEVVASFVVLSVRAANVNESAIEVKNIIHTLPSKHFDFNPNLTATLLQLANNFASEVCMTGWGLFVINRSFILTTAGVVVSYGVILVQLGK